MTTDPRPSAKNPSSADSASIGTKMARGAGWMVGARVAMDVLGMISQLILANLLLPADFGLAFIAINIVFILEMSSNIGVEAAVIAHQRRDVSYWNTAWTLRFCRGLLIAAVLAVIAGPAAEFYGEPALQAIIFCIAASVIVDGLENIGLISFRLELNFAREFQFMVLRKVISFVCTIVAAFILQSYWAFVVGIFARSFAGFALSYLLHSHRPWPTFAHAGEIFHFSKWIVIRDIFLGLGQRLDQLLIGRLGNPTQVGLYGQASEFSNIVTTQLSLPISRAVLPGLASSKKDETQFRKLVGKTIAFTLLITLPAGVGLALIAEPFVELALPEHWYGIVPLVPILVIFGVARTVFAVCGNALVARGKVNVQTMVVIGMTLLRIPVYYLGYKSAGIAGVAWGAAGIGIANAALLLGLMRYYHYVGIRDLGRQIVRIGIAAGFMWIVISLFQSMVPALGAGSLLMASIALGVLSYGLSLFWLWSFAKRPDGPEADLYAFAKNRLNRSGTASGSVNAS